MSIWAEIKHALNSTLGTSSFKPLNEYIDDMIVVAPTSDVIASGISTRDETIFEQTMNLSGQLRISGSAGLQSGATASISIYVNDTITKTIRFDTTNPSKSEIITVSKNDKLKITTTLSTYATSVTYELNGGISYGKNMFK